MDEQRRRQLGQRRRELQKRLPWHYCPVCTMVTYEEDHVCLDCSSPRPSEGWPELREGLDPWLGRVLDERYLLTQQIGRGATASVYRAESMAIPRQFAVKVIYPTNQPSKGPSSSEVMLRLEREVDALGRLRNPHIVRLNDVLELPHRYVAVVMDFVEGDTLEWIVERGGPLPVSRACSLLRQIANGVFEAHLAGFTHRDLKPENIMVERLPVGDDFVHILDFGIVHVDGEVSMTQGFIGTPLYASPEQALGDAVDHRADIYALGAILFFLLTGQPPFLSQSVMQVLRHHVETAPPLLSETLTTRAFPDELESLVQKMLAKQASERPQSLAEVIGVLDQIVVDNAGFAKEATNPMLDPSSQPLSGRLAADESHHDLHLFEDSESWPEAELLHHLSEVQRAHERSDVGQSVGSSISEDSGGFTMRMPRLTASSEARHQLGEERSTFARSSTRSQERDDLGSIELPRGYNLDPCSFTADFRFAFMHGGHLCVHDMQSRAVARVAIEESEHITALALGGEYALLGRANGKIARVHIATGAIDLLFDSVFSDCVAGVGIGPNDQFMMAVMSSGRLYQNPPHKDPHDWARVGNAHESAGFVMSPNGKLFAIARGDMSVDLSSAANPKQVTATIHLQASATAMGFSNDGYLLAILQAGGDIALYETISARRMTTLSVHQGEVIAFCFSEDNTLMTLRNDGARLYVMRAS